MRASIRRFRSALLIAASIVLAGSYPMAALAEEAPATDQAAPPATQTAEPPAATTPAPASTTTATASTSTPPPAPEKTYTYDSTTGRWNTEDWRYNSATNQYEAAPTPVANSLAAPAVSGQSTAGVSTDSTVKTADTNTAAIANALDSLAKTGNAGVANNTSAGNATSGDATGTATIVNMVNSSMTNKNNKEAATFVSNVMGDVNGDIMLQPMLLKAMIEANASNNQQTSIVNDTSVNNDVNLAAESGDASVVANTKAGRAASGSANTVANVVNLVNSMIGANQSFIGTINIYGNLNGDILIAPDFIPQLLASNNNPTKTSVTASQNATVNANDTQAIVNNVSLAAKSGQALVEGNTKAGSATSGSANTNLVLFNLSGHEIVASNSLLVFVNVLGKWVGVIVDAPAGATAGAIGNNVSANVKNDASLTIDTTTRLTNNLNLTAQSGDATVARNTAAGNATTGNATASANIANITGSTLDLSGWFGVLFINVFGSWMGSFGVDTAAGDPIRMAVAGSSAEGDSGSRPQAIAFLPRSGAPQARAFTIVDTTRPHANTAAARTVVAPNPVLGVESAGQGQPSASSRGANLPLMIGSIVLVGVSIYGLRRFLF